MVTIRHALTTPAQKDIPGCKPVRHYTIPSSTMVLPEQSAGQNSPDIRKGRNNPTPNPEKTTKLENGTPHPTTGQKPRPPRTTE